MNRLLITALSLSIGLSAVTLACSSDDGSTAPDTEQNPTTPEDAGRTENDASDNGAKSDAATTKPDAGKKDSGPPPAPVEGLTESEVQALFDARCLGCHGGSAAGGLNLSDFTTSAIDVASAEVPSMKRIAPGDKSKSYLFHKISGTHESVGGSGDRMPKGGAALSKDLIDGIGAYIDAL